MSKINNLRSKLNKVQRELDSLYEKEHTDFKMNWRVSRKIDALAQEKIKLIGMIDELS